MRILSWSTHGLPSLLARNHCRGGEYSPSSRSKSWDAPPNPETKERYVPAHRAVFREAWPKLQCVSEAFVELANKFLGRVVVQTSVLRNAVAFKAPWVAKKTPLLSIL